MRKYIKKDYKLNNNQQHLDFYFPFFVTFSFFNPCPPGLLGVVFLSGEEPNAISATETNKS